jgi:hypothetical protein
MSTISPGPATNSGTAANTFEASRATDDEERGHLTSTVKGKNAGTTANVFEGRCVEAGGVQH